MREFANLEADGPESGVQGKDLAEHNSADKEVDGTANVNEEIDDGAGLLLFFFSLILMHKKKAELRLAPNTPSL